MNPWMDGRMNWPSVGWAQSLLCDPCFQCLEIYVDCSQSWTQYLGNQLAAQMSGLGFCGCIINALLSSLLLFPWCDLQQHLLFDQTFHCLLDFLGHVRGFFSWNNFSFVFWSWKSLVFLSRRNASRFLFGFVRLHLPVHQHYLFGLACLSCPCLLCLWQSGSGRMQPTKPSGASMHGGHEWSSGT